MGDSMISSNWKQLRILYLLIFILYLGVFFNFLLLFYLNQSYILKFSSLSLPSKSLSSSKFNFQKLSPSQITLNHRSKRNSLNLENLYFTSSINYNRNWLNEDNLLKSKLGFDNSKIRYKQNNDLNDENIVSNQNQLQLTNKKDNSSNTFLNKEVGLTEKKHLNLSQEKSVEFFPNPQASSTSTSGQAFKWLNSYSKIPLPVLQEYCFSVRTHCLVEREGLKGQIGLKGDKGDQGPPGLDGRDGLPGEPGLDGMNGRDGRDGENGLDGKHGIPGEKGKDGRDGRDGKDGERGLVGPQGKTGQKGEPGHKGKSGTPGQPGENGLPGLIAWNLTNGQHTSLLFPVSFVDSNHNKKIYVIEGFKLILNCSAIGNPDPSYVWDRIDKNSPISFNNKWLISGAGGEQLIFNPIKREHNGSYKCSANNGLPHAIERIFYVEVFYAPQIYIKSINLRQVNFEVESNPPAKIKIFLVSNTKNEVVNKKVDTFKLSKQKIKKFKSSYIIEFTNSNGQEMGTYSIIAQNAVNLTRGEFELNNETVIIVPRIYGLPSYEEDCVCSLQTNEIENYTIASFMKFNKKKLISRKEGKRTFKCLNIRSKLVSSSIPECSANGKLVQLKRVGIPIYFGELKYEWGSWMVDTFMKKSHSKNSFQSGRSQFQSFDEKVYLAIENENKRLYEFTDKLQFKTQNSSIVHELAYAFAGNSHLIYNNYFIFQMENTYKILKYGLLNGDVQCFDVLVNFFHFESNFKLFSSQHNQIHLLADENSIWAILSYDLLTTNHRKYDYVKTTKPDRNIANTSSISKSGLNNGPKQIIDNTLIIKFQELNFPEDELKIERVILLKNINNKNYGTMFIICGVLYGLDSVHSSQSRISFAFDLYKEEYLNDFNSIAFTNPFQNNNFLTYNPSQKKIYGWDHATLIEYPLLLETMT